MTAIVTGAARGIGAAVARRLAEDGHDVAVLDLDRATCADTVAAVEKAGRRGLAVGVDVTDEPAVAAAVAEVTDVLGAPTVLVNNAGILRDSPVAEMQLGDGGAVLDVHLTGAFLMTRAAQPHMAAAGRGRVVSMSSIAALGDPNRAHYSTAKAGLQGFTKTLARELGPLGITVNAVAPGFTVTDMTRAIAERRGLDAMAADRITAIPVGRAGTPDDIAQAVSFFADERSGFVSGQVLYVAGGPFG